MAAAVLQPKVQGDQVEQSPALEMLVPREKLAKFDQLMAEGGIKRVIEEAVKNESPRA